MNTPFSQWWDSATAQDKQQLSAVSGIRYDVLSDIARSCRNVRAKTAAKITSAIIQIHPGTPLNIMRHDFFLPVQVGE